MTIHETESTLRLDYPDGQTETVTFTSPRAATEWAVYYAEGRGNRDVVRAVVTTTYRGKSL